MSGRRLSLAPPRRAALVLESRAAFDLARMLPSLLAAPLRARASRFGLRVVVVPGFGADDRYTAPLRAYLRRLGFDASGWGMGKNLAGVNLPHTLADLSPGWEIAPKPEYRGEGSVPYLCDRLVERLQSQHGPDRRPLALVGWSLGGYLAREAARDLPELVDRVITLGSPTVGGPKYTAAAAFFRKRGMDLDWIEQEVARRESRPIRQPLTAIYSKTDAIVSWQASIDRHSANVRHIRVRAAHLGLAFNPTVWSHVVTALDAPSAGRGVAA